MSDDPNFRSQSVKDTIALSKSAQRSSDELLFRMKQRLQVEKELSLLGWERTKRGKDAPVICKMITGGRGQKRKELVTYCIERLYDACYPLFKDSSKLTTKNPKMLQEAIFGALKDDFSDLTLKKIRSTINHHLKVK